MKWYFAIFLLFIGQNVLAGYEVHITHKENWFDENTITRFVSVKKIGSHT
jgi:hypothetical protein